MLPQTIEQKGRQIFQQQGERIGALLEPYNIPDEKLETILTYAIGMQARNPRWKQERIVRKTVCYFKLMLKPKAIAQSPESI